MFPQEVGLSLKNEKNSENPEAYENCHFSAGKMDCMLSRERSPFLSPIIPYPDPGGLGRFLLNSRSWPRPPEAVSLLAGMPAVAGGDLTAPETVSPESLFF
ncbi:hypothetical protein [Methanoculleus sp.]|uniref:hypothetical protein n=1 Tax=Methanoculleus sp. TaxID=90427 RepID=UPI0025E394EE|nr:hypothetical protein [Methanoculleus sp.]